MRTIKQALLIMLIGFVVMLPLAAIAVTTHHVVAMFVIVFFGVMFVHHYWTKAVQAHRNQAGINTGNPQI